MKKKLLLISSILLILIAFSDQAWADTIDWNEQYENSGELIEVVSKAVDGDNNDSLEDITKYINDWYTGSGTITISTDNLILSITGYNTENDKLDTITDTSLDSKIDVSGNENYYSGTWAATDSDGGSATISFYVVKASTAYAIYYVNPAASEGLWSVYDIYDSGETNGKGVKSISHLTGLLVATGATGGGDPDPAPEPTTMILFGLGLLGLAKISRRKI